ncbi:MAG: 1-deoxy-D-xylulose-5-phosphate reductoisomerase [Synergistaceae bacterium]|jgi:1-deoxy-D-xylulose-5-phosphate reductoisomerase|nr:1-deoxy-D-xylulose-5-phosphate reductoisomerase [Synergistaceae bacterium]
MKRVAVIGATGSVGSAVMDVCRSFRGEVEVVAMAAAGNAEKLASLAREFGTRVLCIAENTAALKRLVAPDVKILSGGSGLRAIAIGEAGGAEHVVFASSGTAAIGALMDALSSGIEVSLANKESVVVGGPWVMPLAHNASLRPLDSEHNAVWQCLRGESAPPKKVYLTASGGPFRRMSADEMRRVTPEMALKHPVWSMGAKITVDSATLMNKGIELIEASFLFDLAPDQLDALVSPGSFVHGMVEFEDGFVKMLAGSPDMRLPAVSCLFWPTRPPLPAEWNLTPTLMSVPLEPADEERFPALRIAKEAMRRGGAYPPLLVGADEAAVARFLRGEIAFTEIAETVEETLASYSGPAPSSLGDALDIMAWARARADGHRRSFS